MYVCESVSLYVSLCVYLYMCAVWVYLHMYACEFAWVCMFQCMHVCMCMWFRVRDSASVYLCECTYVWVYDCVSVYVRVRMYVWVCMCMWMSVGMWNIHGSICTPSVSVKWVQLIQLGYLWATLLNSITKSKLCIAWDFLCQTVVLLLWVQR
jgi:hypothetical protein